MAPLVLVPIYLTDRQALISGLAERLARVLRVDVGIRPPWFDPESAFDPSRGQYNSTRILARLLDEPEDRVPRVLGITSVDLFVPVLTFVYGEAQLIGRAAVVSIHRLRAEAYGLPPDENLLLDRLEKESVHELGHTMGLIHCDDPTCVMRASTYVEEIDLKGTRFCEPCASLLHPASPSA